MKKTHSANIGGTVFTVEEDAYDKLQTYLQSIELHFRSYPDVAEIVADIEARIAEQLLQRELNPQVVRMSDVDRVIASMGRTEEFAEAAESGAATEQVVSSEGRKLFRDPDRKVIAGVAAGLASYLGLPRLLVRLLLLLLLPFFGTTLVIYLLLWALVPMAGSATEKLQMRGRPLTLSSIDAGVRDNVASIPAATRNAAVQGVTAIGSLIHLVVVGVARAIKWAASVLIVGFSTVGILFSTVVLVVALVNVGTLTQHFAEFFAVFGAWQHLLKVLFYLLVAVPLALIITTALRLFWGVKHLNSRGLAGLLGAWVVALLATAAIWSSRSPELRRFMDEYPVMAEAQGAVDQFRVVVATTSPLSDEQASALQATLIPEAKRRAQEQNFRRYPYSDAQDQLEWEERRIKARQESNLRIVDSAKSYLNPQQLGVMQDELNRYITGAKADLERRRARIEQGCARGCSNALAL